jgi:hypothetical protein
MIIHHHHHHYSRYCPYLARALVALLLLSPLIDASQHRPCFARKMTGSPGRRTSKSHRSIHGNDKHHGEVGKRNEWILHFVDRSLKQPMQMRTFRQCHRQFIADLGGCFRQVRADPVLPWLLSLDPNHMQADLKFGRSPSMTAWLVWGFLNSIRSTIVQRLGQCEGLPDDSRVDSLLTVRTLTTLYFQQVEDSHTAFYSSSRQLVRSLWDWWTAPTDAYGWRLLGWGSDMTERMMLRLVWGPRILTGQPLPWALLRLLLMHCQLVHRRDLLSDPSDAGTYEGTRGFDSYRLLAASLLRGTQKVRLVEHLLGQLPKSKHRQALLRSYHPCICPSILDDSHFSSPTNYDDTKSVDAVQDVLAVWHEYLSFLEMLVENEPCRLQRLRILCHVTRTSLVASCPFIDLESLAFEHIHALQYVVRDEEP